MSTTLIHPVLSNGILEYYYKVGLELDKAFNTHKDKTREGQRSTCMTHAHDVTKNQRRRHWNLQKRIPINHERGTTGHNTLPLRNQ